MAFSQSQFCLRLYSDTREIILKLPGLSSCLRREKTTYWLSPLLPLSNSLMKAAERTGVGKKFAIYYDRVAVNSCPLKQEAMIQRTV